MASASPLEGFKRDEFLDFIVLGTHKKSFSS
ncbi:hypothetical protein M2324_003794 [Rhodovulum sulfidophilum]|nr:hypothetical protein [Rhodovulum sulfidophilum]